MSVGKLNYPLFSSFFSQLAILGKSRIKGQEIQVVRLLNIWKSQLAGNTYMRFVLITILFLIHLMSYLAYAEQKPIIETKIEGWIGIIYRFPPLSQFGLYFERDNGQRYGISIGVKSNSEDKKLFQSCIEQNSLIKISGKLTENVPAPNGKQIEIEALQVLKRIVEVYKNFALEAKADSSTYLIEPIDEFKKREYLPGNAVDNLLETCWAEGVKGAGVGEWIKLTFSNPIIIDKINISVGYDKKEDLFFASNRVKHVKFYKVVNNQLQLITDAFFKDIRGLQEVLLPKKIKTNEIKIIIEEVYPGKKYNDTCISEIQVWGIINARESS